ncbi:MAG TPA: GDP-mannose 4,6-dehydratase [Acidobacteriota bacterium]|nr:GDP-mannose 4,6-dehydratase [Acidobacteriota bacterium]
MSQPHAFITGIAGFAGSYLAEELLNSGFTVSGSIYDDEPTDNIAAIRSDLRLVPLDILDGDRCKKVLRKLKPGYVFHLAAVASVGRSYEQEALTVEVNFRGTLNMLAAAGQLDRLNRFVYVSSADCYGIFSPKNRTLTENQPLNPISPYGISKAAAEYAVRYHYRQHRLPAVISRSFNHSGPRQTERFVIPSFARQVALIEAGRQKPRVQVGDLSARRDFSDVRDIVRGYRLIALKGRPGEVYQLCSGRAVSIQKMLDALLSFSTGKVTVKVDESRLRKAEIPVLRGSNRKAAQSVGFEIRYKLKTTLRDTLEYWRSKVGKA